MRMLPLGLVWLTLTLGLGGQALAHTEPVRVSEDAVVSGTPEGAENKAVEPVTANSEVESELPSEREARIRDEEARINSAKTFLLDVFKFTGDFLINVPLNCYPGSNRCTGTSEIKVFRD